MNHYIIKTFFPARFLVHRVREAHTTYLFSALHELGHGGLCPHPFKNLRFLKISWLPAALFLVLTGRKPGLSYKQVEDQCAAARGRDVRNRLGPIDAHHILRNRGQNRCQRRQQHAEAEHFCEKKGLLR